MMDVAYTILYTIYNTRGHDVKNVAMKTEKIFVERMNKKNLFFCLVLRDFFANVDLREPIKKKYWVFYIVCMIKVMTTKGGRHVEEKHECNIVHAGGDDMINDDIRFLYELQKKEK